MNSPSKLNHADKLINALENQILFLEEEGEKKKILLLNF